MPRFEHPRDLLRFSDFELDPATGELRHAGSTIRLQPQPLRVLLALIRKPGELVTREQLKQELMPDAAFGDADHAINVAVTKLRVALQDSSHKPQFIDTLPCRGYRFVARVQTSSAEPTVLHEHFPSGNTYKLHWLVATALAVISMLAIGLAVLRRSINRAEKHSVVIAAFTNHTGEPALDSTLQEGLSAQLQQSPDLNLLSDQQTAQVLSLMRQPKDARLTRELALEVCLRTSSAVVVHGSIAMIGAHYVLQLTAVSCRTGDLLAQEQVTANSKEQVLDSLQGAGMKLRDKLERLLPSQEENAAATEFVTTQSVEALQAYSLGRQAMLEGRDDSDAIPLFQRAIILDPSFPMAYAQLGTLYRTMGQSAQAAETIRKAYSLRLQVSEREKLFIEALYDHMATGNLEAARKEYALCARLDPRDTAPLVNLASIYRSSGQCDGAVPLLRKALRIAPQDGNIYASLADADLCLGKLDDAKAVAQEASTRSADTPRTHQTLYLLSFLQHDTPGMQKEIAYLTGIPGWNASILCIEASTAAYMGQFGEARSLVRRSADVALLSDQAETAANCHADAAQWEALVGNVVQSRHQAQAALLFANSSDVEAKSAIALAMLGDLKSAADLANELAQRFPEDTNVQLNYVPTIRGAIALQTGKNSEALEQLASAVTYNSSNVFANFLLGEAYLASSQYAAGISEFQKIVNSPGVSANNPIRVLAQLEIGRAFVKQRDIKKAVLAYEGTLTIWKDADSDVPILREAKTEYKLISQDSRGSQDR